MTFAAGVLMIYAALAKNVFIPLCVFVDFHQYYDIFIYVFIFQTGLVGQEYGEHILILKKNFRGSLFR